MTRSRIRHCGSLELGEIGARYLKTWAIECKADRKAGKCVGLHVSFIVAKTLVAAIKSFDPTIALYNFGLSS